jgi:hypothetical protein
MSQARRTLRIPDTVRRSLGRESEPLWYVGPLQTENGHDVDALPLPSGVDRSELRDVPKRVGPSGEHPDESLAKG